MSTIVNAGPPSFLTLPLRRATPRPSGITHVLDKGLSRDGDRHAGPDRRNLGDATGTEAALRLLTARLGKPAAQAALQIALAGGRPLCPTLRDAGLLSSEEIDGLRPDTGAAGAVVEMVVARTRAARDKEPSPWS